LIPAALYSILVPQAFTQLKEVKPIATSYKGLSPTKSPERIGVFCLKSRTNYFYSGRRLNNNFLSDALEI
jgi:hypothetical protein